jgi:ATP synthase protein I
MKTSAPPAHPDGSDPGDDPPFTPLTADEARRLREQIPQVSPWRIVAGQVAVGLLGGAIAAVVFGKPVGWSLLYGAMAVAVPAGVYARALARARARGRHGAGVLGWELIKIALSVALLLAAPKAVPDLSWAALLAGVILATKMYWVAFAFARRRVNRN